MAAFWLTTALVWFTVVSCETNYDEWEVHRTFPSSKQGIDILLGLSDSVDFWRTPALIGRPVDVLLPPRSSLLKQQPWNLFQWEVTINNVGALIRNQRNKAPTNQPHHHLNNFECIDVYQDYKTTHSWLDQLVSEYPDILQSISLGKTLLGVDIKGVEINVNNLTKPGYYIDGGIHAREWIAPAVVNNFLLNLVVGYTTGQEPGRTMAENFVWTIVPILNVDGYDHTWTTDRMWRKTRRDNGDGSFGVDANRNSDINWCLFPGASTDPSSNSYCGPYPFSEPEVEQTASYISSLGNVKAYNNIHSYGQDLYYWDSGEDSVRAIEVYEKAVQEVYGTVYVAAALQEWPVAASPGYISEYAWVKESVKYSQLTELRDQGQYGFLLPEDQICPTSHEIFVGMAAHAAYVAAH
eukprot:Lithocolla_globosa_v1_NODE_949_length_3049_cov_4.792251.p1 type:complete len:409 gc:universal NODE_949_length_3049_cov_4.792251:720-1946(+)